MPDDMLGWEEFYAAVGASYRQISRALDDLGIKPLRLDVSDLRKTQYKREWVEQVIQKILENASKR